MLINLSFISLLVCLLLEVSFAWGMETEQNSEKLSTLRQMEQILQDTLINFFENEKILIPKDSSLIKESAKRKSRNIKSISRLYKYFPAKDILEGFQGNIDLLNIYLQNPYNIIVDLDLYRNLDVIDRLSPGREDLKIELACLRLTVFPLQLSTYKKLTTLDLSSNYIRYFPNMTSLKELKVLNLSHNDIEVLPDGIGELTNLEELLIDDNKLEFIPDKLCSLNKLTRLHMNGNRLIMLPCNIDQLESLQFFGLSNNRLAGLPKEIGYLPNLLTLTLNGNPLCELSITIRQLKKLTCLNLAAIPTLRERSQLFFSKKKIRRAFDEIFQDQKDWDAFEWGLTPAGSKRRELN